MTKKRNTPQAWALAFVPEKAKSFSGTHTFNPAPAAAAPACCSDEDYASG
ncbi:hypothetical protein UYSO10_1760 [Kosakonia radicincitans]|nr:hypothetical protein UYSO10_1760 [Kosakonia radicincitans]